MSAEAPTHGKERQRLKPGGGKSRLSGGEHDAVRKQVLGHTSSRPV